MSQVALRTIRSTALSGSRFAMPAIQSLPQLPHRPDKEDECPPSRPPRRPASREALRADSRWPPNGSDLPPRHDGQAGQLADDHNWCPDPHQQVGCATAKWRKSGNEQHHLRHADVARPERIAGNELPIRDERPQGSEAQVAQDGWCQDIGWQVAPGHGSGAAANRKPGVRLDIEHRADFACSKPASDRAVEPVAGDRSIDQSEPGDPAGRATPMPDTRADEAGHEGARAAPTECDRIDEGQSVAVRFLGFWDATFQGHRDEDLLTEDRY